MSEAVEERPQAESVERIWRPGLFFKPKHGGMWDTWIYHHRGVYYLYYLTGAIGLATSRDGISWTEHGDVLGRGPSGKGLGSGALIPRLTADGSESFLLNFSEFGKHEGVTTSTMFFAQSPDLVNWTRLGEEFDFRHSGPEHDLHGRWDNLWAVPRDGGGYLGYWIVHRSDETAGLGYGESDDGLTWRVHPPVALPDVAWGPRHQRSPEIAAAYRHGDLYYALLGLDDLSLHSFISEDFSVFRPGHTTFVADRPEGPFVPSPKNRRLLVGNASYFTRFVDTPDGVLVNHHSWETATDPTLMGADMRTTCLAPLKRAVFDDDGTLRLTWWEGNDAAKTSPVELAPRLADTDLDPDAVLLLEGVLQLESTPAGLLLAGDGQRGTAFLVHGSGVVEYGDADPGGNGFERAGVVDREVEFPAEVRFRLVRVGRITEFYLDDHLMQCYCLPERGTGRIDLIGRSTRYRDLTAWYSTSEPSAENSD